LVWIYFRTGTRIMSNFTKLMAQAAAGAAGGGDFYPYTVDYSCRFYGNDKLTWTAPSGGNRKTFTISLWAKPAMDGTSSVFFNVDGSGAGDSFGVDHQSGGGFYAFGYSAALSYYQRQQINQLYRDPSAWYHWVFAYDTTATTTADRFKIYVNGVELDQSNWTNTTTFPLNADTGWNESGRPHEIGEYADDVSSTDTHMYMAQFAVVDGQQLDASSFGEFKNGIWVPKDLSSLTWGNNGFWLDFADSSALGNDVSGNNNDFTSSGLTSSDQMTDTPTNNFPTLNPLDKAGANLTISEGNLKFSSSTAAHTVMRATQSIPETGKWYWEVCLEAITSHVKIGVAEYDLPIASMSTTPYSLAGMWITNTGEYLGDFYVYTNEDGTQYGPTIRSVSSKPIGQVAYDADSGKIWYGWDGIWILNNGADNNSADPANGTSPSGTISTDKTLIPVHGSYDSDARVVNFGQDGTFAGNKTAQGNTDANGIGDFYYTVPTGFLSLCTANIPEPTIGPNIDDTAVAGLPEEQFNILLYEGNSTNDRDITGVGFEPDLGIFKNRDEAYGWIVVDRNRGDGWSLGIDTGAQESGTDKFDSFITDGYRIDSHPGINRSSIVNWSWKAGGTASSNTDGSITSTVSANQDAGFSIVTYAGTGAPMTFGHGLGQSVDFMLVKTINVADGWVVHPFSVYGTSYILSLNSATGILSDSVCHTNNSTVIGFNASGARNTSGRTYVAYCFAEVEGFSSFGSYTGNGSTDGTFVYTGFRPAFILYKRNADGYGWGIMDNKRTQPFNVANGLLSPSSSGAEYTALIYVDLLSNGFKWRSVQTSENGSGGSYIYMAFAENPFKYANAR
jgi:hypothetical protein